MTRCTCSPRCALCCAALYFPYQKSSSTFIMHTMTFANLTVSQHSPQNAVNRISTHSLIHSFSITISPWNVCVCVWCKAGSNSKLHILNIIVYVVQSGVNFSHLPNERCHLNCMYTSVRNENTWWYQLECFEFQPLERHQRIYLKWER